MILYKCMGLISIITTCSLPCRYYLLWVQWVLMNISNVSTWLRETHTYIVLKTFSPIQYEISQSPPCRHDVGNLGRS